MQPIYSILKYEKIIKPILLKAGLQEKTNKYHNNIYDDHVKFYLLMLKQETKKSYRDIVEFVKRNNVHRNLMLKAVPHFTTLQKFFQRIDKEIFRRIITEIYSRVTKKEEILGVDTTGIEIIHSSSHYDKRIKKERKDYVKLSLAVNTEEKMVLDAYAEIGHKHDIRMLKEHFKGLEGHKFFYFVGDTGYDSKDLFWKLKKYDMEIIVPQREYFKRYTRTRGSIISRTRKRLFDEEIYHRRSILKSINS